MRAWCYAKLNDGKAVDPIKPNTKSGFVDQINADFEKIGSKPTAIVLGAKGRCAADVLFLAFRVGILLSVT